MPKTIDKHTICTLNSSIKNKGLDAHLTAVSMDESTHTVRVLDKEYGEYSVDYKSFCEKSAMPKHKVRKFNDKVLTAKNKYVGQVVNGLRIVELFFGPDRGYKNRGFYLECVCEAGHKFIHSHAYLKNHKKSFGCHHCNFSGHGERQRIEGILKPRTPTYIYWVVHNKSFPEEYRDFSLFKKTVGDKPSKKSKITQVGDTIMWVTPEVLEDDELNMIAQSIRSAFRNSSIYNKCIDNSRVETDKGPRYRCAACGGLNKRGEVEVDHTDPVAPIDGSSLKKETLIERIWTNKIQILDHKCHVKKSQLENAERRAHKKKQKQ